MRYELTAQQRAAKELIRSDLRFLFTILKNRDGIKSNYIVSMMPYQSLIIDGAESWITAMDNSAPGVIDAPRFTQEEKLFYDAARQSIKLWEMPYEEVYTLLRERYEESNQHFSSLCKPIAKYLRLYDIFGADLTEDNHFCGNTILDALYLPGYDYTDSNYGPNLRDMAVIGGKYIPVFDAMEAYTINGNLHFRYQDYGGFIKSPVGNKFSYRFVLFSILCQVNFVLRAVDQFVVPDVPTKLRFAYILYYYLCDILPQINETHDTSFTLDRGFCLKDFRNAMAHYKLGVFLKEHEILPEDPMFGMTQKAFATDFYETKRKIMGELSSLACQLEKFLGV